MANTQTFKPDGKVQLWQNGVMMGLIPKSEAIDLLNASTYKEINAQAIEWINR